MKIARNGSSISKRSIGRPRRDDATIQSKDRKAIEKESDDKSESLKKKNHVKSIADESARYYRLRFQKALH